LASQLEFTIEDSTSKAMITHQALIQTLPFERISTELDKLIQGHHIAPLFKNYAGLLGYCIDFTFNTLDLVDQFTDRALRYLCLMDHLDGPSLKKQLERLKLSKSFIQQVLDLKTISTYQTDDRFEIKKLMGHYEVEVIERAINYQNRLGRLGIIQLKAEAPCVRLKDLALNGDDLVALGYSGQRIKQVLDLLLLKVMQEELPNDKAALSRLVKELP